MTSTRGACVWLLRVGLELGDPRRARRAGDLKRDLLEGGAGEADDARAAAGGQDRTGVGVDDPPGTDETDGARCLAIVDGGHRGGAGPLDRDGAGGPGRRPVRSQVTVADVAVARTAGLAGAVGVRADAEV